MNNDMSPLSSDPDDFCYFDTETRGLANLDDPRWADVTKSGAGRYGKSCRVIVFAYAIGDGPVKTWVVNEVTETLRWRDAPPDLLKFMARALKGEAWFVAWNSFFDRHVCNGGMVASTAKRPMLPVRTVLDAMAQAQASNLPATLEGASRALGRDGKLSEGKELIALFCDAQGGTVADHPEEWARFVEYADRDVVELRAVFQAIRPLFVWEWEQFWASEHINDIGMPVDRPFVENAANLAATYEANVNDLVKEFTRGACWSVNQHVALAEWVADQVQHLPEAYDILVKKYVEDEEGDGLVAGKLSLERTRVEKLIPYLERLDDEEGLTDDEYDVLQLLEVRLYGASATPKKFAKMLPMLSDRDRLQGQYRYNGAQQTGRYSSKGVQTHNLTRAFVGMEQGDLGAEERAIEAILDMVGER